MDSLLSIVQMPGGVPVATVTINNSKNAGILAAQIIGIKHKEIKYKVKDYKNRCKKKLKKTEKLEELEYQDYLKFMGK